MCCCLAKPCQISQAWSSADFSRYNLPPESQDPTLDDAILGGVSTDAVQHDSIDVVSLDADPHLSDIDSGSPVAPLKMQSFRRPSSDVSSREERGGRDTGVRSSVLVPPFSTVGYDEACAANFRFGDHPLYTDYVRLGSHRRDRHDVYSYSSHHYDREYS